MLAQSENAPAALDKIDALLAQASLSRLSEIAPKTLGLFTFYSIKLAYQCHAKKVT